jgi:hypothetical protein
MVDYPAIGFVGLPHPTAVSPHPGTIDKRGPLARDIWLPHPSIFGKINPIPVGIENRIRFFRTGHALRCGSDAPAAGEQDHEREDE